MLPARMTERRAIRYSVGAARCQDGDANDQGRPCKTIQTIEEVYCVRDGDNQKTVAGIDQIPRWIVPKGKLASIL
jgi:hypothetical protein